ncbi:AUGMIN subunit 8 [Gossypium raimondii]|uniref:AUGMIN subunit 8 n=1 Tax=Gossypium raimondii TaxID=29730 RepID=UPI00063AB814|nr:AUGMIN subunit 8 [Gossypium raimondii]
MDGRKLEQRLCKLAAVEKNNAVLTTSHPRTKEVSSSYEAPTPPTSSVPRRFPSPNLTRTSPTPFQVVQKRAVSAERKHPSTPPSHQNPSTPVHDSSTSMPISSRRLSADRIPESLWPSTMRSHSVSFQSDDISIPVSQMEKEKSGSIVSLDRTLKPPSNVAHKQQSETFTLSRKPSPERKRNLLEGKNVADQSENAKPIDDLPSRLIDHHRWPSRIGGKLSSNSLNKSVDFGDKIVKNLSTPIPGTVSSLKRMLMSNNLGKPLQKTSSDAARLLPHEEIGRVGSEAILINDKPLRTTVPIGILCASSLEKLTVANSGSRSQSPSTTSVSRSISPYPAGPSSPPPRGVGPTPRGVSLPPREVSPTRIRTSIASSQSQNSTSVFSSTPRGVIPTPRVLSPTRMRTSNSSSQSHSSTSVLISTPRGVSPTSRVVSPIQIRTSSILSQSHSSTSVISSTPRVVSPTRMGTSTSSSQSHSLTSVISSTPRGVSPTPNVIISIPRGLNPTPIRISTSSSQSHSSTSVISSTPRGFNPTPRVVSPTRMRTSTSSSQCHSSTSVMDSTPRGASPTPRVVSPTQMRTSTSSSQSHSSTSITSPTLMVVTPTWMRTSTSSSQSHSSTSVISSTLRGVSPTPRVVSPTRMRTSTSSTTSVINSTPRGLSPTPRVVSPNRMRISTSSSTSVINSTPRGVSPSPRVVNPTQMRTSTSSSQSHSSTLDINFIIDFQKVRKSASFIEDAHQLHLLYNRYLQWRYANAHSEAVLYIQKVTAEETLYNVWNATLVLWDALIKKRINLQRLKLELKLNSILNDQMGYLKDWVLLERDHIRCLAGAIEDLKATTLHLPITDGGRADSESLKAAICSVVDVMQAMGSSICSLVPKVEGINNWVSELAAISTQEQNMLDQCEALLASTADLQLEEYSLRSHLIQTKQSSKKNKQPVLGTKTFPWP